MKVGYRLGLSFILIMLFMAALIVVGMNAMAKVQESLDEIVKVEMACFGFATKMIDHGREMSIQVRNVLLRKSRNAAEDEINQLTADYSQARKAFDAELVQLKELLPASDKKTLDLLQNIEKMKGEVWKTHDQTFKLVQDGKIEEANDIIFADDYTGISGLVEITEKLAESSNLHTLERYGEAQKSHGETRSSMLMLGVFALIVALIIAVVLTYGITQPLNLCIQAARSISARDLSIDLSSQQARNDELGVMTRSFAQMIEALREQIQEISDGINVLATSSNEILVSTSQVAAGAIESATAINETMTTVEEVRQAARLSADKAKNVADSAQRVVQVSQTGKAAVEQTNYTMQHIKEQMSAIAQTILRLSEQSQAIGGIIATVTDLADQSNLLAVNAGIEAARAGEHGKGFSVVAQEIKSLAEQSKQATAEVRAILTDVQKATNVAVMATEQGSKAVEAGVKQSAQTGEAVKVLTDTSLEAAQVATQILASSQQQVVGMDQIGVAMENINQAGSQNASAMKQSETAAKNLNDLGQKLRKLVDQFKIKGA